jgi:hypothetical protein
VLARDAGRCVVPGCRHATFVDVHHLRPRSEGGSHQAENLVTLCAAHHRAVHRGQLVVHSSPAGLAFRHADETPYGADPSPEAVASAERVFRGLRHLGFREREAREALAHAQAQAEPTPTAHARAQPVSDQRLLRAALQWLGAPSSSP